MKSDKTWTFSSPIDNVDIKRILRESGRDTRCIRLTIDKKVYTLVNLRTAKVIPVPRVVSAAASLISSSGNRNDGFQLSKAVATMRADTGEPVIVVATHKHNPGEGVCKELRRTSWALYAGDRAGEVVDKVEVKVEVF
jgi:hypothetical protein